jgi:hypothetical protein
MSICFTICPSVSLLLLVFKYCSSRHDGATHIVFMSHVSLCTRLILSFRHLHFFYSLTAALLHIYDHLFFLGLVCALSIWSYLVLCFFLSLFTLAVLQGVVVRSLSFFGPDSPIFRWCNTILRSWGDRWSPMLMLYSLCGDCKENKRIMCYECYSRRGRVLMTRVEKGFPRALKTQRGATLRRGPPIVAGAPSLRTVQ